MSNSFSSAVLSILFSNVYKLLIAILFTPIIVRLLGPARYGMYATIVSLYIVITIFVSAGTGDAVRKYISERPDPEWERAVFGYIFRYTFLLSLLGSIAMFAAAWTGVAAALFGDAFTELFYLAALLLIVNQLNDQVRSTLRGLQLESRSEPLNVAYQTLFFGFAVGLVYFGLGVPGILLGEIITATIVLAIGFVFVSREVSLRSIVSAPGVELPKRQILVYTASSVWFYVFLLSLYHVDILLLQLWSTDEIVGYYKGALSIAEVLWVAPVAIQLALLQRVSKLWSEDDIEGIERQARLATRYVFSITALMVIGLAVLADDFVPLYLGQDFTPTVTPLLLLLPGVLGFALARPSLAINQARRSLRPLLVATGACSVVNLVLNLLLIPPYGMLGAAVATSIGYGSLVVFQAGAARYLGYSPLVGLRWRPTFVTAAITAAVLLLVSSLISSSILALVVVPPLGLGVYATTAVVTGAVTTEDAETIVDALGFLPQGVRRRITRTVDRIPTVHE